MEEPDNRIRQFMAEDPVKKVNRRSLANRENGRKGGMATADKYTAEWRIARSRKGGETTRDMYSVDFYRHINEQRRQKHGWPQGKLRKAVQVVTVAIDRVGLKSSSKTIVEGMLLASTQG